MKIFKIIGKSLLALFSLAIIAIGAFLAVNVDFSNPESVHDFLDNKKKVLM